MLLNGVVLLTCFHHNHFVLHDEAFMTFKISEENPPGVLSEVKTCRCAPLNLKFYVCLYLLFSSYCSGTFHIIHSVFFDISSL